MFRRRVLGLLVVAFTSLVPMTAWAQQASGIAGVVRDTSGGVLPGVTVEAASPALIEKVRVVVSDGEGRYNITDLRPGTYTVTFTLPGFNTFKREGIELRGGFTAQVNADMAVGALEETITVTGAAPLVDTQNTRQQQVVSSELLSTLPTSSKALSSTLIALVPGMSGTTDVGGSSGIYRSNGQSGGMLFHGKGDVTVLYDGMGTMSPLGLGVVPYVMNTSTAQETTVETGGASPQSVATLVMNMIPKEGGNTFAFDASGTYSHENMQSDNLSDELRGRGLTHTNQVLHFYDLNLTGGGPIRQDKLWFFTAGRLTGNKNTVAGLFFNKTQGTPVYTPDLDRPAYRKEWLRSMAGRVTWQATPKDKISGFADVQGFYNRGRGEFWSPEAYQSQYNLSPEGLFQGTWSSPRTNKFLLEAGASFMMGRWPYPSPGDDEFRVSPDDISILELSTAFPYNAKSFYSDQTDQYRFAQRFSGSYVTGSHALKAGISLEEGVTNTNQTVHRDVNYAFLRGVPNSITQFATPFLQKNRMVEMALFVQDQWTMERLTLNYGIRYDQLNGRVPRQQVPATRFIPFDRDFAAVDKIPAWKDINPRFGASYDLFGTGRTALKFSLGRFVESSGARVTSAINPITTSVTSASRTWNDANRNFTPDCDLTNFATNGECGPISDLNFGRNNPRATRYAEDVLEGFGARNFSWDLSAEVQQELRAGVSITAGYYRNWAGNYRVTDNLAVAPEDFDPFCITAPVDPRLPGGGGYEVCGLYDVTPTKFGRVDNLVTQASHYYEDGSGVTCSTSGTSGLYANAGRASGSACSTSDFFGVSFSTRLPSGIQLNGGVDTGRTVIDNCFVVDSPQQRLNCHTVIPFKAQTQFKVLGSFPLPGAITISGTLQNVPGGPFEADMPVPNALIAPSLGRDLAACGPRRGAACTATAVVPLVAPQTLFLDRRTQLDLRLSKMVRMGNARVRLNLDLYNALNSNTILAVSNTYGPRWQQPTAQQTVREVDAIMPGRLVHVGGQLTF